MKKNEWMGVEVIVWVAEVHMGGYGLAEAENPRNFVASDVIIIALPMPKPYMYFRRCLADLDDRYNHTFIY